MPDKFEQYIFNRPENISAFVIHFAEGTFWLTTAEMAEQSANQDNFDYRLSLLRQLLETTKANQQP